MEKFAVPELEVIHFDQDDIIMTSGGCDNGDCVCNHGYCSDDCIVGNTLAG